MKYFSVHIKEGNIVIQRRQEGIVLRVIIFKICVISSNLIFSNSDESIAFPFEQENKRV